MAIKDFKSSVCIRAIFKLFKSEVKIIQIGNESFLSKVNIYTPIQSVVKNFSVNFISDVNITGSSAINFLSSVVIGGIFLQLELNSTVIIRDKETTSAYIDHDSFVFIEDTDLDT